MFYPPLCPLLTLTPTCTPELPNSPIPPPFCSLAESGVMFDVINIKSGKILAKSPSSPTPHHHDTSRTSCKPYSSQLFPLLTSPHTSSGPTFRPVTGFWQGNVTKRDKLIKFLTVFGRADERWVRTMCGVMLVFLLFSSFVSWFISV